MENVKSNSKRVENNLDEFTKKSSYTATAKKTDPDCGTLELPQETVLTKKANICLKIF